ncbi:MAG: alpha-xylosidase [Prevotella sp.]|nr:alpha-xylosidase [Prevotella sp.]
MENLPTNYHLFDVLGFDPDLRLDESLWKAYTPTDVYERQGDICLDVPFRRQRLANDMEADPSGEQETYTLTLRYYEPSIVRVFISFKDKADQPVDADDMLQYSDRIERKPMTLRVTSDKDYEASTADGTVRVRIVTSLPPIDHWSDLQPAPQPTLDVRLCPDGKKEIRLAAYDHFSPPRYDALPLAFCKTGDDIDRATLSFASALDECFCGTGERFSKMDLAGQSFFLKNQDGQGVNNRRTYKNIPFYLSSRMYGCFYHTTAHARLDLAHHSSRSVQFLNLQPQVDAFVIGGDTVEEIIRRYRDLTGYPQMPPVWSFGIWMSRMTYFSADEVNGICDRLRREHYPCDVIHLDTGWFKTDWLCEWKFNEERFPNPPAFIEGLKKKGFRVSLWQLPYVAEDAEQIDEARSHDYIAPLTKKQQSEGSNFSALDYAGTIDFTFPEATEWYKGLLRKLLQMGVVCIKTDFGENIHMDARYKNMPPELLNNLYALLYQRAAFEVTEEVAGQGIVWARAAWAGCQRYPLHWGGDSCSSWDGMAGSLRGGLHFGLSGFAFWSHDVPGFHTLPNFMNGIVSDDVYVRWTQFGVFTSHMRYHGTNKREPWHYPRIADIVKRWWRLRYALIPYIIQESLIATQTGHTLLRALIFHHADDKTCWHIDDQYYFGNDFMVCPVMNSENQRDVYLPEGSWVDFFTGDRFEGARWIHLSDIPLERMPVFVRPGVQIPIYPDNVECTDDMDLQRTIVLNIDDQFSGYPL